jgi:hypothetical protein
MPDGQTFTAEEVENWVRASCAAQGVPVKVADPIVVGRVGALLGVDPGVRVAADGRRAASGASAPRAAATVDRSGGLQLPDRSYPRRVQGAGTGLAGADDGVVEQGGDDGDLSVEVERVPRSA